MLSAAKAKEIADSKKVVPRLDHSVLTIIEKNVLAAAEEGRNSVDVTLPYLLENEEASQLRGILNEQGYNVDFREREGNLAFGYVGLARTTVEISW